MTRQRDLIYVDNGPAGRVLSTPVLDVSIYEFQDLSGVSQGTAPFVIFEDVRTTDGSSETICRILANLDDADSIWFNMTGGVPGVRAPGSFELKPGQTAYIPTRQQVTAITAVAGVPFTALEG